MDEGLPTGLPGGTPQVQQAPITKHISFLQCHVDVQKTDDGGRDLTVYDPGSCTMYHVVLPPEGARDVGNKLFSSVPVARPGDMPK